MFLTLFFGTPLILATLFFGFSSLDVGITFKQWIAQPKAVASLVCMALAFAIAALDLNALLS